MLVLQKWPKMEKNGEKWQKIAKNGQKWVKMAQNWPILKQIVLISEFRISIDRS